MHFQRLRLAGFKSFVDPTEFRIEPGLTGIVGPNGCGKSNLLDPEFGRIDEGLEAREPEPLEVHRG